MKLFFGSPPQNPEPEIELRFEQREDGIWVVMYRDGRKVDKPLLVLFKVVDGRIWARTSVYANSSLCHTVHDGVFKVQQGL